MKLFIDTTNWKLCLILLNDKNKIIQSFYQTDLKKVSDIVINKISEILKNNNLTLKNIKNFYVTKGPGSYTGVRVGLTIVKTLKTIDDSIKVFLIDSLFFQAGNKKAISFLDARSNKSYCGIYDNKKTIVEPFLISNEKINELSQKYKNYLVLKDYTNIDFETNLVNLLNEFNLVQNTSEIQPLYLKNFI